MKFWLCLLACCFTGCITSSGRPETPAQPSIPYVQKPLPHLTAPSHGVVSEDATVALSIPDLRTVGLPEGWREMRVSTGYSMTFGAPQGFVRLVERHGRTQLGQVLFVWIERREWPRRLAATRCAEWVDDTRSCVFVSPTRLNWTEVAARFEELEGWTLDAPCEADGKYRTDSGELQIVRLRAERFDSYSCNAPEDRGSSANLRGARALYDYISSLVEQVTPPPPA